MMWTLRQYRTVYDDLYARCDKKLKAKIDQRLQRLAELGNQAREPVSKPLGDGIFECKADSGNRHVRFLYFFHHGKTIIVTVGIIKKTRKTPKASIRKAKQIKQTLLSEPELLNELTKIH